MIFAGLNAAYGGGFDAYGGSFGAGGGADAVDRLTPDIVAAAMKWGAYYGVPVSWILATIVAESGGNPRAVGDFHRLPGIGASVGLMQVNTVAEAGTLKKAKVTRAMLMIPDVNVKWGTMILRRKYDLVRTALAKARNRRVANAIEQRPALLGELTRLLYTGVDVIRHIYNGTVPDPQKTAATVGGWRRNLVAVAPLAPEQQAVALAPGSTTT